MKSNKLVGVIAVLICVVAFSFLWHQFAPGSINLRPSFALGDVLADEVARILNGNGKIVLITGQASGAEANNATGESMTAFKKTLQKQGKITLAATVLIPRPMTISLDRGRLEPKQLLEAMDKNSGVNSFVIFATLPPYSSELARQVKGHSLTLVAVCGYDANVRRWIESGELALAVVPRLEKPTPGSDVPKTARGWFEQEYQCVTPENIASLPY